MNFTTKFALPLITLLTALGPIASRVQAQTDFKGSFDLPVQVNWSGVVLEPGHYTVSLPTSNAGRVVNLRGEHSSVMVLAGPVSNLKESAEGGSRIRLEELNGVYVVRSLQAGTVRKTFDFSVPKKLRMESERAGTETSIAVAESR